MKQHFLFSSALFALLLGACGPAQVVRLYQTPGNDKLVLLNQMAALAIEKGYGHTVQIVEGSEEGAQSALVGGRVDVYLAMPTNPVGAQNLKVLGSAIEDDTAVKVYAASLDKRIPNVAQFVQRFVSSKSSIDDTLELKLVNGSDGFDAALHVFLNNHAAFLTWVPEKHAYNSVRDYVNHVVANAPRAKKEASPIDWGALT